MLRRQARVHIAIEMVVYFSVANYKTFLVVLALVDGEPCVKGAVHSFLSYQLYKVGLKIELNIRHYDVALGAGGGASEAERASVRIE